MTNQKQSDARPLTGETAEAGDSIRPLRDGLARETKSTLADQPIDQAEAPVHADALLEDAVREGATDVHFDPSPDGVRVRLRVDGRLHDAALLPAAAADHPTDHPDRCLAPSGGRYALCRIPHSAAPRSTRQKIPPPPDFYASPTLDSWLHYVRHARPARQTGPSPARTPRATETSHDGSKTPRPLTRTAHPRTHL
jgi:hypothetical protein